MLLLSRARVHLQGATILGDFVLPMMPVGHDAVLHLARGRPISSRRGVSYTVTIAYRHCEVTLDSPDIYNYMLSMDRPTKNVSRFSSETRGKCKRN